MKFTYKVHIKERSLSLFFLKYSIYCIGNYSKYSRIIQLLNQCFEFQYNLRKIILAFISLARCSAFHLHPSQGSVKAIYLFYSERLTRRFKINFKLEKNSLVDKETTPYCLTDNCNISRHSKHIPNFQINSFG